MPRGICNDPRSDGSVRSLAAAGAGNSCDGCRLFAFFHGIPQSEMLYYHIMPDRTGSSAEAIRPSGPEKRGKEA
ncbi:MAG TPA: hypothetical protein DCR16_04590 [Lachnospiraceae bacterium]|nr:hypothetical protein [Lachnospiraceae bacterium]